MFRYSILFGTNCYKSANCYTTAYSRSKLIFAQYIGLTAANEQIPVFISVFVVAAIVVAAAVAVAPFMVAAAGASPLTTAGASHLTTAVASHLIAVYINTNYNTTNCMAVTPTSCSSLFTVLWAGEDNAGAPVAPRVDT